MKRFLLSRLSALGDVVCTLPAAVALKQTFPDSEVTWAVESRFADVVECCSAVDVVVKVKPRFGPSSWPKVEGEFDVGFDMQGLFKSGIVIAKAVAKEKLGYHWQREMAWLFTSRVLPDKSSLHVVDQYVDVARAAGAQMDRAEFGLKPKAGDGATVKEKLGGVDGPLVIVNPGAGWVTKRWPPEHFATLIDHLSVEGCVCVLIGGKAEADREAVEQVSRLCKQPPRSLAGNTSVGELIALIDMADAHVGGDTGSTHIAAALDRPAIGLYSITRPQRSCPYGQIDRCHYDAKSLSNIDPGAVHASVKEALS